MLELYIKQSENHTKVLPVIMYSIPVHILKLWIAVFFLSGCELHFEPFFEEDTVQYSLYGSMAIDQSVNHLRIMDVNQPLIEDSTGKADVKVIFEDLTAGHTEILNDTIVAFQEFLTQNFRVTTPIRPDHLYKVTVDDGTSEPLTATASAPAITELQKDPEAPIRCFEELQLHFHNVDHPETIHLEAGFPYQNEINWTHISGNCVEIKHIKEQDIWRLTGTPADMLKYYFPTGGVEDPCDPPPEISCQDLDTDEIYLRYYHLSSDYETYYKPTTPIAPIQSPTVEHGIGFFGIHNKKQDSLLIDTTTSGGYKKTNFYLN